MLLPPRGWILMEIDGTVYHINPRTLPILRPENLPKKYWSEPNAPTLHRR